MARFLKGTDGACMHLDLDGTACALRDTIDIAKAQHREWSTRRAFEKALLPFEIRLGDLIGEFLIHGGVYDLAKSGGEAVECIIISDDGDVIACLGCADFLDRNRIRRMARSGQNLLTLFSG